MSRLHVYTEALHQGWEDYFYLLDKLDSETSEKKQSSIKIGMDIIAKTNRNLEAITGNIRFQNKLPHDKNNSHNISAETHFTALQTGMLTKEQFPNREWSEDICC